MKKSISTLLVYGVPIALVVVIIVGLAQLSGRAGAGEKVDSQGNEHIQSIESAHEPYSTTPPTSGPHIGSIARWGVHNEQIPDELQVHNLEDGGVIIHYGPDVSAEDISDMSAIVNEHHEGVILEPYAGMSHPIVLTAWGRIDRMDAFDEDRIRSFIRAHQGIDHHVR